MHIVPFKGPVARLIPYQMDREATPVPLLGTQSLTPVTQGTLGLQAVLVEGVCHMVRGQEVLQLVPVSDSRDYSMLQFQGPHLYAILHY